MKNILWDFDGVILDSMKIRDFGFESIFKDFSIDEVGQLLRFHRENGGLSRYVKIRYFFENILKRKITQDEVNEYAMKFSEIMRKELVHPKNLIKDSLQFIKENHQNYKFHIVSGSDQVELRFLCKELSLDSYFISIHGSPTPKNELVSELLEHYGYNLKSTCLIGDSINDQEAAVINGIVFYGYNNISLKNSNANYITELRNYNFN